LSVLVEICTESVASSLAAAGAGAGRVELCAHAMIGGLTPTAALLEAVRDRVNVPVYAMVRPRGGDFLYDEGELDVMRRETLMLRAAGAAGIVSGALRDDGSIDEAATHTLIEAARPLPFTFHRAFDLVRDQTEALDVLLALGADRVLTSGGAPTALAGANRIAALVRRAGDSLTVMAGGGVRGPQVAELVRRTGVREVHARPTLRRGSAMRHRAAEVVISKSGEPDGYARDVIDPDGVRALVEALR
jgi:copper homeostasis protein